MSSLEPQWLPEQVRAELLRDVRLLPDVQTEQDPVRPYVTYLPRIKKGSVEGDGCRRGKVTEWSQLNNLTNLYAGCRTRLRTPLDIPPLLKRTSARA